MNGEIPVWHKAVVLPGSEWCPSWLLMGPVSSSSFAVFRAVYRDTCQRGFRQRGSCSVQISPVPSSLPPHGSLGRNLPIFSYHSPTYSHCSLPGALMPAQSTAWFPPPPGEWNSCLPWPGHGFVCLLQTTLAGFRVCGEWEKWCFLTQQISVKTSAHRCFGDYMWFLTHSGLILKRASCPQSTRYDFSKNV